jgi:sulfide:quinone oxidoreductase
MNTLEIDEEYIVSSQIDTFNMNEIQEQGIKTIICNRPDNEVYNQPLFEDIQKEANKLGIDCFHLPVDGNSDPETIREEFKAIYDKCEKPILAYCRSGARSQSVWELSKNL